MPDIRAAAQVVQRYAVLGRGEEAARAAGVRLRYVVANPSSYAWFTPDRPDEAVARSCPDYDRWKYGMRDLPPYAAGQNVEKLEQAYAKRRVVYLLGTAGHRPEPPRSRQVLHGRGARAKSLCTRPRLLLGIAGLATTRHCSQALHDVPGVAHNGDRMLTSDCGLATLFDARGCRS